MFSAISCGPSGSSLLSKRPPQHSMTGSAWRARARSSHGRPSQPLCDAVRQKSSATPSSASPTATWKALTTASPALFTVQMASDRSHTCSDEHGSQCAFHPVNLPADLHESRSYRRILSFFCSNAKLRSTTAKVGCMHREVSGDRELQDAPAHVDPRSTRAGWPDGAGADPRAPAPFRR